MEKSPIKGSQFKPVHYTKTSPLTIKYKKKHDMNPRDLANYDKNMSINYQRKSRHDSLMLQKP